jgi:hypothetical protein
MASRYVLKSCTNAGKSRQMPKDSILKANGSKGFLVAQDSRYGYCTNKVL